MKTFFYTSLLSALLLLSGCGNEVENLGGNTRPITGAPNKGTFVSSVEGLEFTRTLAPVAQTTDKAAAYSYRTGELVRFHVGNLDIGESIGISVITPKEIVAYKNLDLNTSIYSSEVNNRIRLLMQLDSDSISENGIQISKETRTAAYTWTTPDYSLNETEFEASVLSATAGSVALSISKNAAEDHFTEALRCVYSGAYRGSWLLPSGEKEGFVGVMIQSNGGIVALGDGQDVDGIDNNNDGNFLDDVIYATGTHEMDTGLYDFNQTYHFDATLGRIVDSTITNIQGSGNSLGYNKVSGVFVQDGQNGMYTASRVGEGKNTSLRYTGFGRGNSGGSAAYVTANNIDPILGLFTLDISADGNVTGLIHDARSNEEPSLTGTMNFTTGDIQLNLNSGLGHTLSGNIDFENTHAILLDWQDENGTNLGYIDGIGCQLQPHN